MLVVVIILFFSIINNSSGFNLYNNNKLLQKTNNFPKLIGLYMTKESDTNPDFLKTVSNERHNENSDSHGFYHFDVDPRLEGPNEHGQLTWYPIGFSKDFGMRPKKVVIRDTNYVVWRDKKTYYGIRDCCSHQGSSFLLGETCKNTITCPYHGYKFDGSSGDLIQIPKLPHMESNNHNIDCFKVVEKGDMVYFNTIPMNDENKNKIDENKIFIEPEYFDREQRVVYLSEDFEHYAKFVSINSLDICHIGFVHTFGNKKNPNPIKNSNVIKMDDNDFHYKMIYEYIAGENSLVNKIYNFDNIIVENEYVLPHSTVARVKFGKMTSTIITHALPISKFKTKLFVKAYRSYWNTFHDKNSFYLFYPFEALINKFGDKITYNTMYKTLKQDKSIVDFLDKTSYESMHGKFSIIYDMFSNHYKCNYKRYYEKSNSSI
jgi:phenylpropionate dioxygenase-like ring-hydroxylating dioxygenase large terminal subunit